MYTCVCTSTCEYTYTHIYIYTYIYIYIYLHIYIYMYIHAYTHEGICACTEQMRRLPNRHTRIFIYIHIHMHSCIYRADVLPTKSALHALSLFSASEDDKRLLLLRAAFHIAAGEEQVCAHSCIFTAKFRMYRAVLRVYRALLYMHMARFLYGRSYCCC